MSNKKKKQQKKKNTSLRLDESTLLALKKNASDNDTSVQKILERLVNDYLNSLDEKVD